MPRNFSCVIDVHSHLFNQQHVPVAGVLMQRGVPAHLAQLLARLLGLITPDSPLLTGAAGAQYLGRVLAAESVGDLGGILAELSTRQLAADTSRHLSSLAAAGPMAALHALDEPSNQLLDVLEEIQSLHGASVAVPVIRLDRRAFVKGEVASLLRAMPPDHAGLLKLKFTGIFTLPVRWLLEEVAKFFRKDTYANILDGIRFFLLMLCCEETLCACFLGTYRPDQKVERRLHLMMDMRYGYPDAPPPHYDYPTLVERMRKLTADHSADLLCFVAFDPRRDGSDGSPSGLDMVKQALADGFHGVKFYPPMGFRPDSNNPAQKRMLDDLFAYCVAGDVPVLTHCTPVGAECRPRAGLNADPAYWGNVLERFPALRLCYGHAGGGAFTVKDESGKDVLYPGWYATNPAQWNAPNNYARVIADHCATYDNVYCDFSYHHELIGDAATRKIFADNLVQAIQASGGKLAKKIMYGSDWHMPSINRHAPELLDTMYDIFTGRDELKPHLDGFLCGNAEKFLKL